MTTHQVKTFSTYAFFDLREWLKDHTFSEFTKRRVTSSMAWNIDNVLISAVRTLFFSLHEQMKAESSIDTFNDYINLMKAEATRAQALEAGGMDARNSIELIQQLAAMRIDWHDDALAQDTKYVMPSLEDQLKNDRPMRVDVLTIKKLTALAEYQVTLYPELKAADVLAQLIGRQNDLNMQAHQSRAELAPHIISLLTDVTGSFTHSYHTRANLTTADYAHITSRVNAAIANGNKLDRDVIQRRIVDDFIDEMNGHGSVTKNEFHQLPCETQKLLIERAIRALGRVVEDASRQRAIDVMEFMKISAETVNAVKELERVLAAPKFHREGRDLEHDVAALKDALEV